MKTSTSKRVLAVIFAVLILTFCLTGCMAPAATTEGAAATEEASNPSFFSKYGTIIIMVVIIVVFYFLFYRPENKKKKALAKMRDEITVGDEIITIGGMTGVICDDEGEYVTFESGEDRVRIRIARWAISTKTNKTPDEGKK